MLFPLNYARSQNGVTGENRTLVERSTVARLSHSATATLGARSTSRTCLSGFSDRRFDRNGLPGELVEEEGIEPSFAGCRPAVLPLNDSPSS
jgi:hypothetical protein